MPGCIFCGTSPTTRTHIFRKGWIDKLMPGDDSFSYRQERRGPGAFDARWEKREFDLVTRAACQTCNGGWMHDIDVAAELLVEVCVLGQATTFSATEHRTLARWITLVSLLYDQTLGSPCVTSARHHEFYETKEPVEGTLVWLAAATIAPIGYELNGWPRPVRLDSTGFSGDGYFCTFRIQHFVAQAFMWPTRETADVTFERPNNVALVRQIWPSPGTPVAWPPPKAVSRESLEDMANAFIPNPP